MSNIDAEPEDRLDMTPEQWAQFKAFTSGYGDQDENCIDLSAARKPEAYTNGTAEKDVSAQRYAERGKTC